MYDVRAGLIKRGLPPHLADAFVLNARDESGLRFDINETSPLVPGSRGGYGLFQWTGPRRRQLENFAAQRARPISDPDVQLDFLMHELQTTESGAAKGILGAKDTPTAAVAIVNDFLRPASEHAERRARKYGAGDVVARDTMAALGKGGGFLSSSGNGSMTGLLGEQPREPDFLERMTKGVLTPDRRDKLVMALQGMTINPNQALMQTASDNIKTRREDKKESGLRSRTAEWLAKNGQGQLAQAVAGGMIDGRSAVRMAMDKAAASADPSVQSSQMLPDMSGTVMTMRDGSIRVVTAGGSTLNGQQAIDYVRQSQEKAAEYQRSIYQSRREGTNIADVETGRSAEFERAAGRVEGTAEGDKIVAAPAVIEKADGSLALIDSILNDPNLSKITGKIQGRMDPEGVSGLLMSQGAVDLAVKTKQLEGQAFLQAFETLKGGGQITEREGIAAQNAIARLQRVQSDEEYKKALLELRQIADNARRRAMGENVTEFVSAAPTGNATAPTSNKRLRYNPETGDFE